MEALPADYGDHRAEQVAVRTAAGVIDLSAKGKTRVTGPDRLSFLDGLLTNDMKTLAPGGGLYAATLDHKGRVHGDLVVHNVGDAYLLETDAEGEHRALSYLEKLLVSDDVTLTDVTTDFGIVGVFGPKSGSILARAVSASPPSVPFSHIEAEWNGKRVRVSRSPAFGGEGYEVWAPANLAAPIVRELKEAGARPFGRTAAEALRIEAGRPKYPADMNEETLALEARLDDAISMTKGCYIGQEVVSRATYIGHVNRAMVGLEIDGQTPPSSGTAVTSDGAKVGSLTSVARSEWLGKVIALGYVRVALSAPGTPLAVDGTRARVAALPFVR